MQKFNSRINEVKKQNIEYEFLPYQIFLFTFCGLWSQNNWSKRTKFIYNSYFFLLLLICFFNFIQTTIYVILNINNMGMIDLFFFEDTFFELYKALVVKQKCQDFKSLLSTYCHYNWIQYDDSEEKKIYDRASSKIK